MSGSTAISKVDSLAIGNFDGMHLGHRALFERLTQNGVVCVIEHYRADMTPHIYRGRYTTFPIFFYDFDMIRDLQPKNFVDLLNRDFPLLKRIAVGEDFHFGSGRSADVSTLKSLFNGEVVGVDEVKYEDKPINSRLIR
ncbi:MAG: bifunctional riboflavin kinase/FAD synthetase, partial [Hydrogenimonas sp.]|nr:bifunctional riboflavin kinase/FAD synthetase [Hydrogenimonas sp.]